MKTLISAALILLGAIALPLSTANADWRGHNYYRGGHGHSSDWGHRHYYGHGWYGPRWYGGPGYYGGSSIYITAPVYTSDYYPRRVYQGREVTRNSVEVDVQVALRRKGYYSGPIDGDIGPMSRAAIRAYQLDHNLRPTGTITDSLLERLL